jgi:F-type H+-transporting ATPase subunit epsilon
MPLQVQVVTPERELLVEDDATFISVRALGGDMGILPGIAPQLAALGIGPIKIVTPNGERKMLVDGGFLIVKNDRVTVLAEYAVTPDEMDAATVSAEIEELKRRLQTEADDENLRKDLARRQALHSLIQIG